MKNLILIISILGISINMHGQDSIFIFHNDGNVSGFATQNIDSITFYEFPVTDPTTVTDIDGNTYGTIRIGSQLWMSENLRVTKFNDGTEIFLRDKVSNVQSDYQPMYSWYNDNSDSNKDTYGALYTRSVISYATTKSKNICPVGWHVPNDGEWQILADFLGGTSVAGAALKQEGTEYWSNPNYASNSSAFNALPGGHQRESGEYANMGNSANFWTQNESEQFGTGSRFWVIYNNSTEFTKMDWDWYNHAFSVRCLKDE